MDRKKDKNFNSSADFSIGALGLSKLEGRLRSRTRLTIILNRDRGMLYGERMVWDGKSQERGSHCPYEETADYAQHDAHASDALADETTSACLTVKTVTHLVCTYFVFVIFRAYRRDGSAPSRRSPDSALRRKDRTTHGPHSVRGMDVSAGLSISPSTPQEDAGPSRCRPTEWATLPVRPSLHTE